MYDSKYDISVDPIASTISKAGPGRAGPGRAGPGWAGLGWAWPARAGLGQATKTFWGGTSSTSPLGRHIGATGGHKATGDHRTTGGHGEKVGSFWAAHHSLAHKQDRTTGGHGATGDYGAMVRNSWGGTSFTSSLGSHGGNCWGGTSFTNSKTNQVRIPSRTACLGNLTCFVRAACARRRSKRGNAESTVPTRTGTCTGEKTCSVSARTGTVPSPKWTERMP